MADAPHDPERRSSGTKNAERSAAMRRKLIDAAIGCLCDLGFGKTTLQRVTDRAGVSRGAVLHHFPTRVDLLLAVAEASASEQDKTVARKLAGIEDRRELYDAITQATWEAMVQPPSIALLEIMMGARSDAELAEQFPPFIERRQRLQRESVWEIAKHLGVEDRDMIITMVHLHLAAMRGLVLEYTYSKNLPFAERSMQLLQRYKTGLTEDLLRGASDS